MLRYVAQRLVLSVPVLLSVLTPNTPLVPASERVTVHALGNGFHRVVAKYGYRQSPRVPEIMRRCRDLGLVAPPNTTTYYVGRETLLPRGPSIWPSIPRPR